ncbi:MAG TPA: papain-like cysteine protease family protein [Ktedonobacteraceae bacterium]|nr:papain-like cysteine protease family protein [Ktedonobacteraceae bacterium]
MKRKMVVIGVGLFLAVLVPVNLTMATEVKLHIAPVFQERPSWCWAAVGEMVFKYYYVPAAHRTDYQCGIVQGRNLCMGIPNCVPCDLSAGDAATMVNMLEQYPLLATPGGTAGDIALTAQSKSGSLSEVEVKKELDEGRPIIVGISPPGFKVDGTPQHMALIVGYDDSSDDLMLTVNDPFPYEDMRFLWIGNAYLSARASGGSDGEYEIGYEAFRLRLKWTQTIYRITCTGHGCPSDNHQVADGSAGKDDRDVTQTVLMASSGDFKTLRTGHKAVDADSGTTWQSKVTFPGAKQCLVRDKDDYNGARWSCIFRFADRSEADKSVEDIVNRLRNSLPHGWIGTDLDEDSDTESYIKTEKFSAYKPGNNSVVRVYLTDTKKDGRVKVYLSVDNN